MSALGSNIAPMLGEAPRAVDRRSAARMLGVSEKTIEREMNRGKIPGFKVGSQWRILIRDLETYIEQQQATQRARVGA